MTSPKVEIYTKWGCPYCVRAKALLDGKGVAYEEYDITLGGPKMAEMQERVPGARTVPQILIAGEAVGGYPRVSTSPARAPVWRPFSTARRPLTSTCRMPSG